MDGISGKTKTELTLATARENKTASEAEEKDLKKFNPATMQNGEVFSPALECKRMLQIDGNRGAISNRKYAKREVERRYYRDAPDFQYF